MDRSTLADELRAARFRTTQFRTGYDEGAVDDLIDMLVGQLGMDVADHEILATVQTSRFPTTTARRGYERADVDALLARVIERVRRRTDAGGHRWLHRLGPRAALGRHRAPKRVPGAAPRPLTPARTDLRPLGAAQTTSSGSAPVSMTRRAISRSLTLWSWEARRSTSKASSDTIRWRSMRMPMA